MADILLVNPLFLYDDPVESQLMTPYFPLGILYIAAVLRDAGYDVAIFDAMFASGDEDFLAVLEREKPRVVGFGVLATVRRTALRLAGLAKQQGAWVLMGGADPTARPDIYLKYHTGVTHPVDIVVVGESEETILDLVPRLFDEEMRLSDLAAIQGVAYQDPEGEVVQTPRRKLLKDIDAIPFPARELLDLGPYRRAWREHHGVFSISLIATRGCPFNCAWCQKIVFGRSFRPRSPESVAEEMRVLKTQVQPDFLRIVDDAMGIDKAWIRRWHAVVLEKEAVIPFECLSRVDLVDREMALLLKQCGCQRIAFGAESGSQKVLDAMTKGTTVAQIYRAAEICRELDIETYFYMMVGYPTEVWDDLRLSVRMLRETRPDCFSTTIAYPLPGTAFYERVKDRLPEGEGIAPDWDYTAENKLLFGRGRYNTLFYRRVIRWFHHEWEDAWIAAGKPVALGTRIRTKMALWRDRFLVHLLARMPGTSVVGFPTADKQK